MPSRRPPRPRPTSPPSFPKPHCTLQGRTTLSAQRPPLGRGGCLRFAQTGGASISSPPLIAFGDLSPLYEEGGFSLRRTDRVYAQKRRSAFAERRSSLQFSRKGELVELLSVLPSRFRLLLTLQAGADIMLSLLDLGDHTSLCTAALEPLQSILQGLAFLDANFRHRFPSLRRNRLDPDCFQGHSLA